MIVRAAFCLAVACCFTPIPALAAIFTGLGFLPNGSRLESLAQGVSADGSVVVGRGEFASGQDEAFRWTQTTGMVGLGSLPSSVPASFAHAASSNGAVVVGQSAGAFIWTASGRMIIADSPSGALFNSVSADGVIAVGYIPASGGTQATRWTASTLFQGLGFLPGQSSSDAHDISNDGTTIIGVSEGGNGLAPAAFRWTQATGMVALSPPDIHNASDAFGVSADGSVIVGQYGSDAFRWTTANGIVILGDVPDGLTNSTAFAVSADGSIVVGKANSVSRGFEAFIWDAANGMRSLQDVLTNSYGLDLSGWTLYEGLDISADGRTIVGDGMDPNGHLEAFVVVLPEPSAIIVLGTGLAMLLAVQFTRRRKCEGSKSR
ncbi:MAG TPA: hypothetical protein VGI75_08500 [Pirellulales bacterium]|jgi:probable HAF family extracellular repeat protein